MDHVVTIITKHNDDGRFGVELAVNDARVQLTPYHARLIAAELIQGAEAVATDEAVASWLDRLGLSRFHHVILTDLRDLRAAARGDK